MSILKNGYTIDYANNTVRMTKDFSAKAQVKGTHEYKTIKSIKKDFPDIEVEQRTVYRVKKKPPTMVSYKTMRRYIGYLRDGEAYRAEMENLIEFSGGGKEAYPYVNLWFLERFPNYKDFPKFDEEGYLILPDKSQDEKNNVVDYGHTKAS